MSIVEKLFMKLINESKFNISLNDYKIQKFRTGRINWIFFQLMSKEIPLQGFKLHISSSLHYFKKTLETILPLLLMEKTSFKVVLSKKDLESLNNGIGGLSQIGKIITIYPYDADQTLRLAKELDKITKGTEAPIIPFERSLSIDSCVYYRYGAFKKMLLQKNTGEIVHSIMDPSGKYQPDERNSFALPNWISDPFIQAGFNTLIKHPDKILLGRYLRLNLIQKSPRGSTWLGLDLKSKDIPIVIIKNSNSHVSLDKNHNDSMIRLKNESLILKKLWSYDFAPKIIDYWEENSSSFLVYDYIHGADLFMVINRIATKGMFLEEHVINDWLIKLCRILNTLHKNEITYRDLKPSNIIIDKNNQLYLIDYENSYHSEIGLSFIGSGTRGYSSSSQLQGANPSQNDDIYSLGTILFTLLTLVDLTKYPNLLESCDALRLFNKKINQRLINIVKKCISTDKYLQYSNVNEILYDIQKTNLKVANKNMSSIKNNQKSYLARLMNSG